MATWGIVPRRAVNKTRSLRPSIIISVPSFIGIQTQPLALRIAGSKHFIHSKFSSTNLFNFLRPSLSPEMVWLPPSSPSSSSVLTLEEEEDEEEDNISFIFIEQSRITHRLSPLSLFAWYPLILFKSLGWGGWKHVKILWITNNSLPPGILHHAGNEKESKRSTRCCPLDPCHSLFVDTSNNSPLL